MLKKSRVIKEWVQRGPSSSFSSVYVFWDLPRFCLPSQTQEAYFMFIFILFYHTADAKKKHLEVHILYIILYIIYV